MNTPPPGGAPALPATASRAHRWAFKAPSTLQGWYALLDRPMLGIWAYFSVLPSPIDTPMRYMSMGYFLLGLILFHKKSIPAVLRGWPSFMLAILAIVSMIWAPSPPDALRKGLLFAFTAVVAIYVACRIPARHILLMYMLAGTVGACQAILGGLTTGNWITLYGQKNYLAVHMFILYVCSLTHILDKQTNARLRLFSIPPALTGLTLIMASQSATTVIMLVLATGALFGHAFLWEPATRTRNLRTFLAVSLITLSLAVAFILFGLMQFDAESSLLEAFGKDSTLTGRTWLWDMAWRSINEHPWTGVGADGYWRAELGNAHTVLRYFHYDSFIGFSFHNSYLENGVSYGYLGLYSTIFLSTWALWNSALTWLRNQTMMNVVFLVFAIVIVIRSNGEIDLAAPLTGTMVILLIGAIRKDPKPAALPAQAMAPSPYNRRARR